MNNQAFIMFLKKALEKPVMYMWGDYGRIITESTIKAKAKQYPEHYDEAYQAELRKRIGRGSESRWIGCDCTGLIKWFLWTAGDIEKVPKYDAATDNTADGWYRSAKVRGEISSLPETPGLILSTPGHCGVYAGGSEVIECVKDVFGNGIITTRLSDRKWEHWCECANINYQQAEPPEDNAGFPEVQYRAAHVIRDCPAYSTLNKKQKIGMVFKEDEILYLGSVAGMSAVIYPTSTTEKIAFIDNANVIL